MNAIAAALGLLLVAAVGWDVFQSVLLPRPTPSRVRIGALTLRHGWPIWRGLALRLPSPDRRERYLGMFAPFAVVFLLVCWLIVLIVGFGLLLFAVRDQLAPVPDLAGAIYLAGLSVLTLGFSTTIAGGPVARFISLAGAAAGLGVVALVITYLFMLFGSFQRREILVVALTARAGAPPSGVALLESFALLGLLDDLTAFFEAWETWAAEVLDSHVAYPILGFFRSSHDNTSWVSALGAVLDAASLVRTSIPDLDQGRAELAGRVGGHFVEDISNFLQLRFDEQAGVSRAEFEAARRRLARAGFRLADAETSWQAFSLRRAAYAGRLNALARFWATPAADWIGDPPATGSGGEVGAG